MRSGASRTTTRWTMRRLTLVEYRTQPGVALSLDERDLLRRVAPSVDVTPTLDTEGHYDLRPGSMVGAVDLRTLAIEIRPKLPIERLLFLISYTLGWRGWQDVEFDLAQADSLVEAIVPGFVSQVRRALQRGVLQGYRVEEDALLTVRGRVRVDDQLRRRFGRTPPVEARYDEFTEDIEKNRLLKAAIARLRRLRIRSDAIRHALRAFDLALAGVSTVEYHPRALPEIVWTRLNERYRPAVALARLILRATSFDTAHGAVRASSFLLDMNEVFEDFVVLALRGELRLDGEAFPQGSAGRSLALDAAGRVRLRPDISWWEGRHCRFVGDVKYKRTIVGEHADLYQLLAYTVAAGLPGGLLVYAAGEGKPAIHEVVNAGKRLEIVALDLAGPPDDVLSQVARVAQRIRQMRRQALADPLERLALSS